MREHRRQSGGLHEIVRSRRQFVLEPDMKSLITAIVLTLGLAGVATAAYAEPDTFPDGFFEKLDQEGPRHSVLPQDPFSL